MKTVFSTVPKMAMVMTLVVVSGIHGQDRKLREVTNSHQAAEVEKVALEKLFDKVKEYEAGQTRRKNLLLNQGWREPDLGVPFEKFSSGNHSALVAINDVNPSLYRKLLRITKSPKKMTKLVTDRIREINESQKSDRSDGKVQFASEAERLFLKAQKFEKSQNLKQTNDAFTVYRRSADLGHVRASGIVAHMFASLEESSRIKHEEAAQYASIAAKSGDAIGVWCSAYLKFRKNSGDPKIREIFDDECLRRLKRLADSGDYRAAFSVGLTYHIGMTQRVNPDAAIKWLIVSAEKKYPPALFVLGTIWGGLAKTHKDHRSALNLIVESANSGFRPACSTMGQIISEKNKSWVGLSARDKKRMIGWVRTAACDDHESAQLRLGNWTLQEDAGADKTLVAAYWFRRAVAQGSYLAAGRLAQLFDSDGEARKALEQLSADLKSKIVDRAEVLAKVDSHLLARYGERWTNIKSQLDEATDHDDSKKKSGE